MKPPATTSVRSVCGSWDSGSNSPRRLAAAVVAATLPAVCFLAACGGCGGHGDERGGTAVGDRPSNARFSNAWPSGEWIDLTHSFDGATIYWPTESGFRFERGDNGPTAKGYYYAANRFASAEHGGTHLDAPIHFHEGRHTVDEVGIDRLCGEAVVIDVREACSRNPDYEVTPGDLFAWEERTGRRLLDVIVLVRTGWAERWPDRLRYLGTAKLGPEAVAELHFPGLSPEAAAWLVEQRRPKSVGIDTASIDHGPSTLFRTHVVLCGGNVPIFENVADLGRLPETGAFVAALPMKIGGGSGGPLRIVARLP